MAVMALRRVVRALVGKDGGCKAFWVETSYDIAEKLTEIISMSRGNSAPYLEASKQNASTEQDNF